MANLLLFVNNATSSLLGNIGPTDTALALLNGDGAKYPSPTTGYAFLATIEDSSGNVEIVECTGRTGDILTVVRGREGTAARSFTAGAALEARTTAGTLSYLDWQSVKNTANSPLVLDDTGKAPVTTIDTPVKTIGDARYQASLGFTPVEQNGGTGMQSNKIRIGWDGTFLLAQIDSSSYQVPLRTSAGTVLQFTSNARYKAIYTANEDQLSMGPNGWYLYSNAGTAFGAYHATLGGLFTFNHADKAFNTSGTISQQGTPVALNGHTHAIGNIAGLQGALDSKYANTGGYINGNVTVAGTITAGSTISAPSIRDTSDARVKTDVSPMSYDDAVAIVRGTHAVRYFNKTTQRPDFGVIAQDQVTTTPEIVMTGADGLYSVGYQRLVAPMAAVLQNLLTRVDLLEAKNA